MEPAFLPMRNAPPLCSGERCQIACMTAWIKLAANARLPWPAHGFPISLRMIAGLRRRHHAGILAAHFSAGTWRPPLAKRHSASPPVLKPPTHSALRHP